MRKLLSHTLILLLVVHSFGVHAQKLSDLNEAGDALELAIDNHNLGGSKINEKEQRIIEAAKNYRLVDGNLYRIVSQQECDATKDSLSRSKEKTQKGKSKTITENRTFDYKGKKLCWQQKMKNVCEEGAINIHEAHHLITSQFSKELSVKMIPGYDAWRNNPREREVMDKSLDNILENLHGVLSCSQKATLLDDEEGYKKQIELIKMLRKLSNFKNVKDEIYGANKCSSRYHDNELVLNPVMGSCYLNENDPTQMLEITEIAKLINATNDIEEFLQAEKYRTPDNRPNTNIQFVKVGDKKIVNKYSVNNNPDASIIDENDFGERIYYFGVDSDNDGRQDKVITQDEYYNSGQAKGWKVKNEYSDLEYHVNYVDPFSGITIRDKNEKLQLEKKVAAFNAKNPNKKKTIEKIPVNKYVHTLLKDAQADRKYVEKYIQKINQSDALEKERYDTAFSDLGSLGSAHQSMYFTSSRGLAQKMLENKLLINNSAQGNNSSKWNAGYKKYLPGSEDYIKVKTEILNKMCPKPNHNESLGMKDQKRIKEIAQFKCREGNGKNLDEHLKTIQEKMKLPETQGGWRNLHTVNIRDNINKSIKYTINKSIVELNKTKVNGEFDFNNPKTQTAYQNYVDSFKLAGAEYPQNNLMFMESDKTAFNLITTNKCPSIIPIELKDLQGKNSDIKVFEPVSDEEIKCAIEKSNNVIGAGALSIASDYYHTIKDVYDSSQLVMNGLPDSVAGILNRQANIKDRMANLGRYVPELLGHTLVDNPSLIRHYCDMIERYELQKNLEKGAYYTVLAASMVTGLPAGVGGLLGGAVVRTGTGMVGRRILGATVARSLGKGGELVIRNIATFDALAISGAALSTMEVAANYHVNVKPAEIDAMMMTAMVVSGNSEDLEKMTNFNKTKNTEKWWNAVGVALAPLDLFAMNEFAELGRAASKSPSHLSHAVESGSFMRKSLMLNKAKNATSDFTEFLVALDSLDTLNPLAKARLKNYLAALNDDTFGILQTMSKNPKKYNKFLSKIVKADCLNAAVSDECLEVVEGVVKFHNSAFYQAGTTDNFYMLNVEQLLELKQDIKQSDKLHDLIYFEDGSKILRRSNEDQMALIELYGELKGIHKGEELTSSQAIDKFNDAVKMCASQ